MLGSIANAASFSTHLQTSAELLLDVSLYVSYENYYNVTSPGFTTFLPWYANYIVPPTRRTAARARTAHLGLSALDVDTSDTAVDTGSDNPNSISGAYEQAKRSAGLPTDKPGPKGGKGLFTLGQKPTVLSSPEHATRFKLDALANSCLLPLAELLDDKDYMLGTSQPTSLDCLALGYLALMVYPALKQNWLQDTMKTRFPKLEAYTRRLAKSMLGTDEDANVTKILSLSNMRNDKAAIERARAEMGLSLPWYPPAVSSIPSALTMIGTEIVTNLPGYSTAAKQPFLAASGVLLAAAAGGAYHYQHTHPRYGDIVFENPQATKAAVQPSQYGEAGAMLAALGDQLEYAAALQRERQRMASSPIVEVDVEVSDNTASGTPASVDVEVK